MTEQGGVTIPMAIVAAIVGVIASLAVGAIMRLAHKGALSDISESVRGVKSEVSLLRLELEGELRLLNQANEFQRRDMNAMDARLTQVEREWRRYYGGIARALPTPRSQDTGGHSDPDE